MIQLRPYQLELVQRIVEAIQQGYKKILTVLPTGGGKSLLIGAVLNQLTLSNQYKSNLAVTPFAKLRDQLAATLASMGAIAGSETYHATVQKAGELDVLVLDEAHHIMGPAWRNIPEQIKSMLVLGFTATPYRADNCPLLEVNGGFFDCLILGPDITTLTKMGYLANLEYYSYPLVKVVEKIPVEFLYQPLCELENVYYRPDNKVENIVEEYVEGFNGMAALVFCKTVAQAQEITAKFDGAGIKAGFVSCYQSRSLSTEILNDFKRKQFQILSTCNMGSEGLDIPHVKLGIMARRIVNALTLFLQQVGRILRPYENEPAKLLDLVSNWATFGHPLEAAQREIL